MRVCQFRHIRTYQGALLACLEGLEPPTYWFVASHSIRLSYRHIFNA